MKPAKAETPPQLPFSQILISTMHVFVVLYGGAIGVTYGSRVLASDGSIWASMGNFHALDIYRKLSCRGLIFSVVNRPRFGRYSLGYVIQLDCTG